MTVYFSKEGINRDRTIDVLLACSGAACCFNVRGSYGASAFGFGCGGSQ